MINLLKIDFKRAIYNKQFLMVVLIGILLAIGYFFTEVVPNIEYYKDGTGVSIFVRWISYDFTSTWTVLLTFMFPVLASITYSDSYWLDLNSGFVKNVYTRTNKTNYLISRYITNFIMGGISVIIPLVANLYILFMTVPAVTISIFNPTELGKEMFSNLFYSHPYIYILTYLFINFMFGGIFASIGLSISKFCKNRFVIICIPAIFYLSMYMFEIVGLSGLVPGNFLSAGQNVDGLNIMSIIVIFMIFFGGSVILYIAGEKNHEII